MALSGRPVTEEYVAAVMLIIGFFFGSKYQSAMIQGIKKGLSAKEE